MEAREERRGVPPLETMEAERAPAVVRERRVSWFLPRLVKKGVRVCQS